MNYKEFLKFSGVFEVFDFFDVIFVIGREYFNVDFVKFFCVLNLDELFCDFVIISEYCIYEILMRNMLLI